MADDQGLSPLARGNPANAFKGRANQGPIPARTGQPLWTGSMAAAPRAYPRSHGATVCEINWRDNPWGLSPLARGNPHLRNREASLGGPIPARTGQPCVKSTGAITLGAYPRSHGATARARLAKDHPLGLSPLARGNPFATTYSPTRLRAYPRSHGATVIFSRFQSAAQGLSPLARGNLDCAPT